MEPDTAPAAQPSNDAPAVEPSAPETPDYSSPNDLDFEMSAEEEQAFVERTLGVKNVEPTPPEVTPPTGGEPEAPATPKVEEVVPAEPAQPETPPPAAPIEPEAPQAPTEIVAPQSDDLWIEVQDSEGKDVKLVYNPDDPSSFLPDDFTFKNDKQLMDIMEAKAEMANLYKERVTEYDTEVEKQAADVKAAEDATNTQAQQAAAWDAEIQDLIATGQMPAPKITDPKDPNFMKDPVIQLTDNVFKFMAAQNTTRSAEDKPLLRSFTLAKTMYEAEAAKAAENDATKKANELAKARGSLVGGSSAASNSDAPIYIRGSARNTWEASKQVQ